LLLVVVVIVGCWLFLLLLLLLLFLLLLLLLLSFLKCGILIVCEERWDRLAQETAAVRVSPLTTPETPLS